MPYQKKETGGSWAEGLDPAQQRVWDKLMSSDMSLWPGNVLAEVRAIVEDWDFGFCGEVLCDAAGYWCCLHVRDGRVPVAVWQWLEGREEMTGGVR